MAIECDCSMGGGRTYRTPKKLSWYEKDITFKSFFMATTFFGTMGWSLWKVFG